jgi:hypothetical protein
VSTHASALLTGPALTAPTSERSVPGAVQGPLGTAAPGRGEGLSPAAPDPAATSSIAGGAAQAGGLALVGPSGSSALPGGFRADLRVLGAAAWTPQTGNGPVSVSVPSVSPAPGLVAGPERAEAAVGGGAAPGGSWESQRDYELFGGVDLPEADGLRPADDVAVDAIMEFLASTRLSGPRAEQPEGGADGGWELLSLFWLLPLPQALPPGWRESEEGSQRSGRR